MLFLMNYLQCVWLHVRKKSYQIPSPLYHAQHNVSGSNPIKIASLLGLILISLTLVYLHWCRGFTPSLHWGKWIQNQAQNLQSISGSHVISLWWNVWIVKSVGEFIYLGREEAYLYCFHISTGIIQFFWNQKLRAKLTWKCPF